jgi:hypothetical protein
MVLCPIGNIFGISRQILLKANKHASKQTNKMGRQPQAYFQTVLIYCPRHVIISNFPKSHHATQTYISGWEKINAFYKTMPFKKDGDISLLQILMKDSGTGLKSKNP